MRTKLSHCFIEFVLGGAGATRVGPDLLDRERRRDRYHLVRAAPVPRLEKALGELRMVVGG